MDTVKSRPLDREMAHEVLTGMRTSGLGKNAGLGSGETTLGGKAAVGRAGASRVFLEEGRAALTHFLGHVS